MDINENMLDRINRRNDKLSSEGLTNRGDHSSPMSSDNELQREESPYKRERTESGNHSLIIIPDTPSPVFSKFKRRKEHEAETEDHGSGWKSSCDKKHKKLKKDLFYPHSQGLHRHHKDSCKPQTFCSKLMSPTKIKINPYIPPPTSDSPGFVSAQDVMKLRASLQNSKTSSVSNLDNACNIKVCPQEPEFKKPFREDTKEKLSVLDRKSQHKLYSKEIKAPKHTSNHRIKNLFDKNMGKTEQTLVDGINHPCEVTRKRSLTKGNVTHDNATERKKKKISVNHGKNVHSNNGYRILNTVKMSPLASKKKKLNGGTEPMFSECWPSESESEESSDSDSGSLRDMIMGELYQTNRVKQQEAEAKKSAKLDKVQNSGPDSHLPSLGTSHLNQRKRNYDRHHENPRLVPDTIHLKANTEGRSEGSPIHIDISAGSTAETSRVGVTNPDDATKLVEQVVEDEDYAKKLQEEMDMEYAMSLQNLENQPPPPSPQSAGWATPPHHYHTPINTGSPVLNRGHWAGPHSRNRFSGRQPDLEEMEAMLNAWNEPEETVQVHRGTSGTAANRRLMRAARPPRIHNSLESLERINAELTSAIRANTIIMRGSRRRAQRRNAVHDVFFQSPVSASGNDYEDLLNLAELLGDVKQKGLTDTQRSRLPERTYQANDDKDKEECMICMCEYDLGDNLKILPCFHEFHSGCIDKWIKGNATCPICRVEVKIS